MTTLADIGAVVAPIVPAFYAKPKTVDDIINHTVGRLLDFFGIETKVGPALAGRPAGGLELSTRPLRNDRCPGCPCHDLHGCPMCVRTRDP